MKKISLAKIIRNVDSKNAKFIRIRRKRLGLGTKLK